MSLWHDVTNSSNTVICCTSQTHLIHLLQVTNSSNTEQFVNDVTNSSNTVITYHKLICIRWVCDVTWQTHRIQMSLWCDMTNSSNTVITCHKLIRVRWVCDVTWQTHRIQMSLWCDITNSSNTDEFVKWRDKLVEHSDMLHTPQTHKIQKPT